MIGQKIKEMRQQKGLTLRDVAEKTSLTPGFLSQVERGLTEPSLTSLRRISDSLDVPIFYFLLDDSHDNVVVRRSDRKVLKFPGAKATFELLTPSLSHRMEVVTTTLLPGASTCDEPLSHSGEEFMVVIEGQAAVEVGGDEYQMDTGDSIYFFASIPHRITSTGEQKLVFITAISPPTF